eukprot:TRINITY_DN13421_c0_g1_i1.p1 TRINITY_DN13421_c0_g1~~TRINITY_DN13421_c0_g1_i1.p1  ORF type:complete len:505 (+),score=111.39 TRINITY_DN13421_c0_g1_i1:47-1561(+)
MRKTIRPVSSTLARSWIAYQSKVTSRFYSGAGTPRNSPEDAKEALEYAKKNGAQIADLRFCDLHGAWQHLQFSINHFDAGAFQNGFGFDGSSIRGWQPINMSDMLLIPNAKSRKLDPFTKHPTITFICSVVDPITKEPYSRDPRHISIKATEHLRETGIADYCNIGPEAEFFLFDNVSFGVSGNKSFLEIDSSEAHWNSDKPHTGHYKIRPKEGYFPVKPWDQLQDIRSDMVIELENQGFTVEASHHEVGSAGQCEIDFKFDELVQTGDNCLLFKYIIRNVASRHGKLATFMPKPYASDNGSGMHTHVSFHSKDGSNLFTGDKYAGLSEMALHFIGGLMTHAKSICAFSNPTINSYKRLVPGFEAPINMAYSGRNRSASIRIPISHPKGRRLEFRTPDPSCNPYLSFSAILMAGLDGIQRKIHPGEPLDKDIYSLSEQELINIIKAPGSLEEALIALEQDHAYLTQGDVFTPDLIDTWISMKKSEIDVWRKTVTPLEYQMYYDC